MDSEEILIEFLAKNGDRSPSESIQAVNAQQLKNNIQKLVSLVQQIAAETPQHNALSLDEVEVSLKITETGEVVLLGDGQSNGAMRLRFRRSPHQDGNTMAQVARAVAPSLTSITGIDYSKLQTLLASAQWQEANQETWNLMCQAAHKKVGSVLSTEEIKQISCQDLKMIDQLWQQHSQGRFGFSAQNQVYMSSILG
jgi:hypothetical protein